MQSKNQPFTLDSAKEDFLPLAIHKSAWQQGLTESMNLALNEGRIPSWWMYQSRQQSACWQEYQASYSPWALHLKKMLELYQAACTWMSRTVMDRPIQLISLGPGDGTKDLVLIEALLSGGTRKPAEIIYTPMDISTELCVQATRNIKSAVPGIQTQPLVVQLEQAPRLRPWLMKHEIKNQILGRALRIITCFGIFPNMPPDSFLAWLKQMVRPLDWLLISANLSPPMAEALPLVMPQYENPLARAWYKSALTTLGVGRQRIKLELHPEALNDDGSAWQVRLSLSSLNAKRSLKIKPFSGTSIELILTEPLLLFFSNRINATAFVELASQHGLCVEKKWLEEESCWEGIFATKIKPVGTGKTKPSQLDLENSAR